MTLWLRFARAIDRLNEAVGRVAYWLLLLMVALGAFYALGRYAGKFLGVRLVSNAVYDAQWFLFGGVFLLGAAYTLRHNAHVRVDVVFDRFSPRTQAWVNVAGLVLLLLPFCLLMLWASIPMVENAWAIMEGPRDPGGLPRYPIKTLIPAAFVLLLLQGLSELIKNIAVLRGAPPAGEETPVVEEVV